MPHVVFCDTDPIKTALLGSWAGLSVQDQCQLVHMMTRWRQTGPEDRVHYGWYDTRWLVLMQYANMASLKGLLLGAVFDHQAGLITVTSCDNRSRTKVLADAIALIGYQPGPFTLNKDWPKLNRRF